MTGSARGKDSGARGTTAAAGAVRTSSPAMRICEVVDRPLDVDAHRRAVDEAAAGATVTFCGVVRDHDGGRAVVSLDYVGHPSAEAVLAEIVAQFADEPDVLAVAVSHRIGALGIGDIALVAAVSTAHRGAAFEACGRLVDQVKHRLPIWKRQVFDDGTDEWVNCP